MASGVNTAQAAHTIGMSARSERPCARKPEPKNSAANSAPSVRCQVTFTSGGSGIAGAVTPEGATSVKKLNSRAQSTNTIKVSNEAAGNAPVAASARQAMAMVAQTRTT